MPTLRLPKLTRAGRPRAFVLACLAWAFVLALTPAALVLGQEEEKAADAAPAAVADAAPAAGADAAKAPAQKSLLVWTIEASGPIGLIIILMSVYLVAIVIRLFLEFRVSEAVPAALIEKLEAAIKEKKFQEAYDACRDDNSFLARLVRTGVANLPNGRPEAKEAMNVLAEEIIVTMEAKISYLATIGTLGPMLGLLGTVLGMIGAFRTLATTEGGQAKPQQLAGNISTALFTTLEGIIIAVPAIFFFAFFRNRIALIAMESTKVAERTIAAFWAAAKQPGAKATV